MKMSTSVLRMGHADVNLHGHVPCNLVVPATVLAARYFTCIGGEPRPYLSGYFRTRGLKLNWLYKFSPWFDVMLHVKFESPMRTAIGKYDGEWHVRVMST